MYNQGLTFQWLIYLRHVWPNCTFTVTQIQPTIKIMQSIPSFSTAFLIFKWTLSLSDLIFRTWLLKIGMNNGLGVLGKAFLKFLFLVIWLGINGRKFLAKVLSCSSSTCFTPETVPGCCRGDKVQLDHIQFNHFQHHEILGRWSKNQWQLIILPC